MKKVITQRTVRSSDIERLTRIHPVVARVLAARGCVEESSLDYRLQHVLPATLKGIPEACALLVSALQQQLRILIVGDFDVDGATSTSLVVKCLRQLGATHVDFLVPNRFEYGYGLTPEIVALCKARQPDLIVTVDNGISSIEGVRAAKDLGIKVLVTDHHLPGDTLPDADAIVNPNQPGCTFPAKSSAGVCVVFYVMLALRANLRNLGWFSSQLPEPDLAEHLDLLALGTVADVVPLEYNNRILVSQGITRMRAGYVCEGIKALLTVAGKDPNNIDTADLGFAVGPRLNAAGRLDDMTIGIRCLLSEDPQEALALAEQLNSLNLDRRSIEGVMQEEANIILDKLQGDLDGVTPNTVCLYHPEWHQGVIGILASRVKDRLHRPVIVFADDKDGMIKGSGRSIPGVHLRDVLDYVASHTDGVLTKFGGHAMAAGLSLHKDKLPEFAQAFEQAVESQIGKGGIQAFIETDGELEPYLHTVEFAEELAAYGPWGQGFPEPSFHGKFHVVEQRTLAGKHLKLVLAPALDPLVLVDAIAFNVDMGLWNARVRDEVTIVYALSINEFRGVRTLQLMVNYMELTE